jgi:hypothetical protein
MSYLAFFNMVRSRSVRMYSFRLALYVRIFMVFLLP